MLEMMKTRLPILRSKPSQLNLLKYFSILMEYFLYLCKLFISKFRYCITFDYRSFVLQEAAYESASSSDQGIFSKLVSATEERPWLWVIYVLSILIPIIIIAVICFGRKSRPVAQDYKKTDEVGSLGIKDYLSTCFKFC